MSYTNTYDAKLAVRPEGQEEAHRRLGGAHLYPHDVCRLPAGELAGRHLCRCHRVGGRDQSDQERGRDRADQGHCRHPGRVRRAISRTPSNQACRTIEVYAEAHCFMSKHGSSRGLCLVTRARWVRSCRSTSTICKAGHQRGRPGRASQRDQRPGRTLRGTLAHLRRACPAHPGLKDAFATAVEAQDMVAKAMVPGVALQRSLHSCSRNSWSSGVMRHRCGRSPMARATLW